MKDNQPLEEQIRILAEFLLTNFPDEPGKHGQSEGAIEVAIRLLRDYHPEYTDHQRKLKELTALILRAINETN
jgi:hypothetical protein